MRVYAGACLALMVVGACTDDPGAAPMADTPGRPAIASDAMAEPAPRAAEPALRQETAPAGKPSRAASPQSPFVVVGTWAMDGRTVVVLRRGGQSFTVSAPGKLDEQYAVQSIDERRIVLKYLPADTLETLALDSPTLQAPRAETSTAGRSTRGMAPVAPVAPTSGDEDQPDN